MKRSAARSSSAVLTPGLTLPARRFIVRTRIAPAAAIRSISSGLFLMIIGLLHVLLEPQRRDHRPNVIVYLGWIASPVDAAHQPLLVVVGDQRLGLLVVHAQPVLDHVGLAVVALYQA